MNAKNNLRSILNGQTLVLRGESGGHGVKYTAQETTLCAMILSAILPAAEVEVPKPVEVDEHVNGIVCAAAEAQEGEKTVAGIARTAFRAYTKIAVEAKLEGFPKDRDPTSIQLLFRAAAKQLGVDAAVIDGSFKRYGAKTK
jgi:hypothetical protein